MRISTELPKNFVRYTPRILTQLANKVRQYRSKRRIEEEMWDKESKLHQKKYDCLDSLQYILGQIIDSNLITVNNEEEKGYSIIINGKDAFLEPKSEYIRPVIMIRLDGKNVDDLTLTLYDSYIGNNVQIYKLQTCQDYSIAKKNIHEYLTQSQGSWILKKN